MKVGMASEAIVMPAIFAPVADSSIQRQIMCFKGPIFAGEPVVWRERQGAMQPP